MASAVSALYEPLIARDLSAVRPAIREFRRSHTSEELALAVGRFAILAYAPSQHAKHAVLAVVSAFDLRDELGSRWDDLLTECACYAAASRQPWSEPPLIDPPQVDAGVSSHPDELRAAITAHDRLRAERWLAARLQDPALTDDLLTVAAEDLSDMGHKLIMTNGARKLVPILGEKGKFVTLRMAVWELTAYEGPRTDPQAPVDAAALLEKLIARCVEEEGSLESAHAVFLFDAAFESGVLDQVSGYLARTAGEKPLSLPAGVDKRPAGENWPIYSLGRDLGASLKANAVAKRLRSAFPAAALDDFVTAVQDNLENAPSLEEWSFA